MPSKLPPVGRKRINDESVLGRFPKGTKARIELLLEDREARADFIRKAVESEIERRQSLRDAVDREIRRRAAADKRKS